MRRSGRHELLGVLTTAAVSPEQTARARVRAELGHADADFVIGLLGRFDTVKGQLDLIQAVARLYHGGMTRLRLVLLGFESPIPESTVRGWLAEPGVEAITRITGKRPDIAACLNALDLGVVASRWSETIARAALEIMATGVPLIGTDVGVMPDLLEPEALFPAADLDALADRIRTAHDKPDMVHHLRQTQAKRMSTLSGHDFLTQTLKVYES